jgi:hypothetical protein
MLALDDKGDIYISGSDGHFRTLKYTNNGTLLWDTRYANVEWEGVTGGATAMALDGHDHLYLTGGHSIDCGRGCWGDSPIASLITTLRYDLGTTSVPGHEGATPRAFALSQNFPNPFNPTTAISYQLPAASDVRLSVFDLLGREVAVLVDERKAPGSYEVQFDAAAMASGVYSTG